MFALQCAIRKLKPLPWEDLYFVKIDLELPKHEVLESEILTTCYRLHFQPSILELNRKKHY